MVGRKSYITASLIAVSGIVFGAGAQQVPPKDGGLNIGDNLKGWVVEGTDKAKDGAPIWKVSDHTIVCRGSGFGFLRYDRLISDFSLSLEFRLEKGANSGVGIRHGAYTGERQSRPSFAGFEIQLVDDAGQPPTDRSSGSLYRYIAPRNTAIKPAGEWNHMIVECRGPHIKVTLNGELVQDLDQTTVQEIAGKPLKGYISLQNHGSGASFRDVRLKQL
jgi:hypothetical protein